MTILNGIHYVVRFRNNEMWHFNSIKSRGIFLRRMGANGLREESTNLIPNTHEDFSVKIDNLDHLHLVCRTAKGEIQYMFYDGSGWSKQVLSRYDPVRYVVRYPIIIPINDNIHVIFAIGTTFNTGFWSLYHYYWNGHTWHSTEITKLTAGFRLSPFYLDISDKHIHLVYRGLESNKYQIYYCRYHLEHGIWSTPENVTNSTTDCNMPSLLIRNDKLHLTWTSLTKNDLTVKYKSKPIRNLGKVDWSDEIDLSNPGSNAALPRLLWVDDKLWCIWNQADTLYGCYSKDEGVSWSTPEDIDRVGSGSFHHINYCTNKTSEKQVLHLQWILGNVDHTLILPVVTDFIELPKYVPESKTADWDPSPPFAESDFRWGLLSVDKKAKKPMNSTPADINKYRTRPQSVSDTLLNEIDQQEGYNDIILSKLEEQAKLDDIILTETREIIALLKENTEKLQALLQDMEELRNEIKPQTRGLLTRLFRD